MYSDYVNIALILKQ